MSSASEASTTQDRPRRLYVSLAVRAESIRVGYGFEDPSGDRFTVNRSYRPPHGGASFVDDLQAIVEAMLGGDVIQAATVLLTNPLK